MNTNSGKHVQRTIARQQIQVSLHPLWIGLAAFGCAMLMETKQVDYAYPFELFLKGVMTDNTTIDDHLYKIKL